MKPTKRASHISVKILLIGNSFTARNNLPGLLAQLAGSRGKELEHRLIWAGGASLRMHWNKGDAQKAIQQRRYDTVVLQEQSTLPIKNPERMHENIRLAACVFFAVLFNQSPVGIESEIPGLSREDVKRLQSAASDTGTSRCRTQ